MFADEQFRRRHQLSAVNSINWARIVAQTVYYVCGRAGAGRAGPRSRVRRADRQFRQRLAGYVARQMGLPIGRLIVASNRNDILARVLPRRRHGAQARRALALALDGHPGLVELRAAAVRPARPRRCGDRAGRAPTSARAAGSRSIRLRVDRARQLFGAGSALDEGTLAEIRRRLRDDRRDSRPAHRRRHRRGARGGAALPRADRGPGRPRIRRSSPMRSSARSASVRRCRRAWPTSTNVRNAIRCWRTTRRR